MKIRSHLYVLALGAILPLLIVSLITGVVLVRYDRETFEREALGRARSAMTAVNAELRGSITAMQALASSKSLAAGDIRSFHAEARRVLANQQQDWRNIGLATVNRVQLMDALEPYGAHAAFGANDPSFDIAINTRRPAIGDVIPGPVVKEPVVRFRVPVIVDGEVRYVMSVPMDPVSMQKVLAAQQLPEGWAIGLADRNRDFVARIPPVPVGTPVSKDFKAAIERAPQGWFFGRTLEGRAVYTPYVTSAISGWVLGISIPASLVDAAAWHTFWLTFSGVLFALAVALALVWIISRRIADPIAALAVAAEGVSTGTDVAVPATRRIDEFARLHDTLRASSRAVGERRALLEKERATLREQAALLDLAHDAIMVRTTAGVIIFWSRGAEETYGWTGGEAIGRDINELLHTEFPRAQAEIEPEFERTGRWDGILRHVRKDGVRIVIASRWALRRAQSGNEGLVLEINRDITRQTSAEESAARLNEELQEANQRKDQFLATLAHELRNPLAPITNCVTMLKSENIAEHEKARARDVIERQAGLMARLLDDLLDMSRITHGKLELRRQRVELAQVVEAAAETCRPQIESGGHRLEIDLGPAPLYLDADPARLAQILSNLLHNAAKYSNAGTRIRVTAAALDNEIVLSVRDEGIGIARDMLPRIFDIFAQADPAADRTQGGMGIGLSLVRAIAELHGGRVEAHSAGIGKGSEFIVHLPAASAAAAPHAPERAAADPPAGVTRSTFLVADDLADSADSLAILLRQLGHEVHTAYDGEQALAAAAQFKPSIALLDIGMPKLSGYEVARKIREQPWGRDMLLIALSGWGQQEDRRRSKEAGFTHHLVKPLEFDELTAILKSMSTSG